MRFHKNLLLRVSALASVLLVGGCGGGGGGTSGFSITPAIVTLTTWDKQRFSASAAAYWDVQEPGGGFFEGSDGVYTASYLPGTYHVVARKQSDTSQTATATVRVVVPPEASIDCPSVVNHDTKGVTARAPLHEGWTYTWSLQGATIITGQSTATITFDAPTSGSLTLTCNVRNEAGKLATETTSITVAQAPAIASFKANPEILLGGQSTQLTATFSGATARVDGLGPVQNGIPLTVVPPSSTTYILRVANQAGEEVTAPCSVQVTPVVVSSDPTPVLAPGNTLSPSAVALGTPDPSVTWELQEAPAGGTLTLAMGAWTYTAPASPGTYHLIARSASAPTAQLVVPVTVFEPFSAFRVGGYAVAPYDDRAAQPTAFGWARQSRFTGPRVTSGPHKIFSLAVGNPSSEILLGPRGEFFTAGKKWDAYGHPIPAFQPANTYILGSPAAIDRQGRLLVFDYLFEGGTGRLCAQDPDTGALRWATPVAWDGAVSCRLTLAEDGRMAVWNNWNGSTGNTLMVLSSEGVVLWTKALPQYGEAVFCPDGGLIHVGYREVVKWDAAGNQVWRLTEDVTYESLYNGYHPRGVINADGTLFITSRDGSSPAVFGLTAISADGAVLWRCPLPPCGYNDPYLTLTQDGTVICSLYDSKSPVVAVDATGQIKWQYTLPSGTGSCGEALVDRDGVVYIASRAPWPNTTGRLLAFTVTGALLWGLDLPVGYYNAPRLTLGPRHELYVTWTDATWVLQDPPAQP